MYWNTVTLTLQQLLKAIMKSPLFDQFCLVGGTSLSLQMGHRFSVDIDLFTDVEYGLIDFDSINNFFRTNFPYVDTNENLPVALGKSWYVGASEKDAVKIDMYYTDTFIRPEYVEENIRLAAKEDVTAMKLDVIGRGGRKKDFWDVHELHTFYTIPQMIGFYHERYPYNHTEEEIRKALINFDIVENDFDPQCLHGKSWELIKLEIWQWVQRE